MLRSVKEVIYLLSNNKDLFEALFEKRNMQVSTMEAESYIKESQSLAHLEQLGLITSFQDSVVLGSEIEQFLESLLVAGGGSSILFNYDSLFKEMDAAITLYYKAVGNNRDGTRHLKTVYGLMKKIPNNLVASFNKIRVHVEFTYKSARDAKEKIDELHNYEVALRSFIRVIDDVVDRLKRHNRFFDISRDIQLLALRNRVDDTTTAIRLSLVNLTEDVVKYISRAKQETRFYKHLQSLLELCDRRELTTGTNAEVLVGNPRFALASGHTKVPKKHRLPMLHPDFVYEEKFAETILRRRQRLAFIELRKPNEEEIDPLYFEDDTVGLYDFQEILEDYLGSGSQRLFFSYMKERCEGMEEEMLLDQYVEIIVDSDKHFQFLETYTPVGDRLCIDVLARPNPKEY